MHFHLPKPLHGWREFAGEVGIIVIGVLIALGAEQAVERLHHRSQIHEAIAKLHAESVANRGPLELDVSGIEQSIGAVDADLAALGDCDRPVDANQPGSLPRRLFLVPTDSAWLGVRDSDLLPLMPVAVADGYFKIDTIKDLMLPILDDAQRSFAEASARIEAMRGGLRDRETCRDAVIALHRFNLAQQLLLRDTVGYREFNEKARRGEQVDAVNNPAALNLPNSGPPVD